MGTSRYLHQAIHEDTVLPHDATPDHYNELRNSITVWELRAQAAWKDANEAEVQGQWEDLDYYVDLAELCEEMAWITRTETT